MTYQDFDLNARYELLNRAMNQDNTLDSEVQQSLHQLDYLVYHELVNLGQKTPTPNFAKLLFPLQEKFKQFKEFCEFPAITQKNIVAIGGKFSAGKSTFINNLLGKKRLAVEIDPTTSIPTYILKGEQNQIVGLNLFNRQVLLSQDEFATLTHEEKEKYGSQVGRLLKSVFITDSDFRWENLALLDTPGYTKPEDKQQSERTDADVAHAQLNSAQFIIWLVSAEDGGIKDDDLAFLASLNRNIPKLVLITKSDRKTPDEVKDIVYLTKQLLSNASIAVENVLSVSRKLADYPLDDVLAILDKVNDDNQEAVDFGESFYHLFSINKKLVFNEKNKYENFVTQVNQEILLGHVDDREAQDTLKYYKETVEDLDEIIEKLDKYTEEFCSCYDTIIHKLNVELPTMSRHQMIGALEETQESLQKFLDVIKSIQQKRIDEFSSFDDKLEVAKSDDISDDEAEILAKDDDFKIRLALAGNSHISEDVVAILLEGENEDIILAILSAQKLDMNSLKESLSEVSWKQRQAVAKNPFLTEEIQCILANDSDYDVRIALAKNETLKEEIQQLLVNDNNDDVKNALLENACVNDDIKSSIVHHRQSVIEEKATTKSFIQCLYEEFGDYFCNVSSGDGVIFSDNIRYGSKEYKIIDKIKDKHDIWHHIDIAFDSTIFGSFLDGVYICASSNRVFVKPKFGDLVEYYVPDMYDISYHSGEKYLRIDYDHDIYLSSSYARRIAERVEEAFSRYERNR